METMLGTLMLTLEIELLHTVNLSRYKMAIMSMIIKKDKMVYDKNSPLLKEARKPPLKFVKYHNYGLKKLRRNKRGYN